MTTQLASAPKWRAALSAVLISAALSASAQAHFIWVVAETAANGEPKLQLSFGEGPQPAEAFLLDRVAHAKTWAVDSSGKATEVKLTKQVQGDEGAWVAKAKEAPAAIDSQCQYGVFTRGEKSFLLNYFARYQELSDKAAGPSERLKLAVVPSRTEQGIELTVYWQGKPATEGVQLVVEGPDGQAIEPSAMKDGKFLITAPSAGIYAIRARIEEPGQGKVGDDAYEQVLNYSTLTLRVPTSGASK